MRLISLLFLFSFGCLCAQEDFNLEVVSIVAMGADAEGNEEGNDIWGFEHSNGIEYAIMGARRSTKVYSLADPTSPELIISIPGSASTWRDMKEYNDYVYVTADSGNDGLLVIDLTMAPDSVRFQYLTVDVQTTNGVGTLGNCHNIYIDENGFAYLAGSNVSGANQAIIMDLNQDAWTPPIVGTSGSNNSLYSHDLYVRDDIMYSSRIVADPGNLAILDVSDKTNPIELGSVVTSNAFTHNTWISDDGNYAFTTDEVANGFVDSYDITDFTNIRLLDKYQPLETQGTGVIPHNTHYYNGYLVTSWYSDGIVITDAHKPDNLIKVAAFDTYKFNQQGFNGCWGAYPFLPSGLILASNINDVNSNNAQGELIVLSPTYVRACYLEGKITDADSGAAVNEATIRIVAGQLAQKNSDAAGDYKTGLAQAGTYQVEVSHPNYVDAIAEAVLINGEVTILDFELNRLPEVVFTGMFIDATNGNPIENGVFQISNNNREIVANGDADGNFTLTAVEESYTAIAGAWGYQYAVIGEEAFDGSPIIVELTPGYYDDFEIDLGWSVTGDASTGIWERDVPNGTTRFGQIINPDQDVDGDIGNQAFVTGNTGGDAAEDDIDGGLTRLTAPVIDISTYMDPVLKFRAWYWIGGGNGPDPNDTLFVRIWDKNQNTDVAMFTEPTNGWTDEISINLKDLNIDLNEELTLSVLASDNGPGHLVEAGFDAFRIIDGVSNAQEIARIDNIQIYPNPFNSQLFVELEADKFNAISIFDQMGKLVHRISDISSINLIDKELSNGFYYLVAERNDGIRLSQKIVKQK